MKKLIFTTLTAAVIALCAGGTPAAARPLWDFARGFPQPAPKPTAPPSRIVVMPPKPVFVPMRRVGSAWINPDRLPEGTRVEVVGPYWSFTLRSDTGTPDQRFAMTMYFGKRENCETTQTQFIGDPDVTYISDCSETK